MKYIIVQDLTFQYHTSAITYIRRTTISTCLHPTALVLIANGGDSLYVGKGNYKWNKVEVGRRRVKERSSEYEISPDAGIKLLMFS